MKIRDFLYARLDEQEQRAWSPSQALGRVRADRALVDLHKPSFDPEQVQLVGVPVTCLGCMRSWTRASGSVETGCPTIRLLAAPYWSHTDYREEWTP